MQIGETHSYISKITTSLANMSPDLLLSFHTEISRAIRSGSKIFVAGNGGSSAIASHFATDLTKFSYDQNLGFSTFALGQNSALYSALANDYGFENGLVTELSTLAKKNDLLVVISSSGNSNNILKALIWASENQLRTVALTGFIGAKADRFAQISLNLKIQVGDYGSAEDIHSIICHSVINYLSTHDSESED